MIINGTKIDEKYIGRKTAGYVGHYETDGKSCNCSWFNSRKLCRHLFVYREYMKLDLFDTNIFPTSFLKHWSIENIEDDNDLKDCSIVDLRLASPGMEYLIEEEKNTNKKLKKNQKINQPFDQTKVAAEYLSR